MKTYLQDFNYKFVKGKNKKTIDNSSLNIHYGIIKEFHF